MRVMKIASYNQHQFTHANRNACETLAVQTRYRYAIFTVGYGRPASLYFVLANQRQTSFLEPLSGRHSVLLATVVWK